MIPISKPLIGNEEIEEVTKVLKSGIIASGPKVKELEQEFAAFIGAKHAVAVSNGTCAIHVALYALGIGPKDKVIVPPFTFIATSNAVLHAGAEPVFVDVKEDTFNIDPDRIEAALKKDKKIKAIICVHLYGRPCEMGRIMAIAEKYKVKVIEDAAQAHGTMVDGKKAGSIGHAASFSMYATKNMATGEGGMVTTNSDEVAEKARIFRNHGQKDVYYHTQPGYNYRMTDLEAAIGLAQLKKLNGFNEKRRANAAKLTAGLKKLGFLSLPGASDNEFHIYHQYTVKVTDGRRDAVLKCLNDNGVGAKIFYPIPIHLQPFYRETLKVKVLMPVSEKLAKEVISVPVHPGLTDAEIGQIVSAFEKSAGV